MKFKLLAIAAIVSLGAASSAFATSTAWTAQTNGQITFGGATPGPQIVFKPSANVSMAYDSQSTGVSYTVGSYHAAGTKIYGTSSADAKIYMWNLNTPPGDTAPTKTIPADTAKSDRSHVVL